MPTALVLRTWRKLLARPCGPGVAVTDGPGGIQARIVDECLFEPKGAFRRMLPQAVPQAIAWEEIDGRIAAYALAMPCTDEVFAFFPDRIARAQQLGLMGVWVRPQFRGRGLARKTLARLGTAFSALPPHQFVLSAEPRTIAIAAPLFPLPLLARWAWQQPSREVFRRRIIALKAAKQLGCVTSQPVAFASCTTRPLPAPE